MSWLKYLSRGTGPQVVCFPHSGGAASTFRPLAGDRLQVIGVQYPGRQDRFAEPVITDLHTLADEIAAVLPPGPSVYFGHSMGAILAYEVAQRVSPVALIASARPAPSRVRLTTDYLLSDEDLVAAVTRLGGTESQVLTDPGMRSVLLPMIRGDYQASETYRHRGSAPLGCPLIALAGSEDPAASVADAEAWSAHTTGPFRLEVLSGDHFYLFGHWPAIASLIWEVWNPSS